jgi:hypothetical protein
MAKELELTLMLADYHRTRPILSGEVNAYGIKFVPRRATPGEACLRPVYEEFDIAEMSLSWYAMSRCRGGARHRFADLSAADADPSLYFLLFFVWHRGAAGSKGQENRHG